MLANILRLREMRVDDIMIPRADIDAISVEATLAEALAAFRKSGHSRMPVFRETLDDPVGLVHIKDLIDHVTETAAVRPGSQGEGSTALDLDRVDLSRKLGEARLIRNILFVPASMRVAALLANMQAARMQMALVIDEYGGTDGLVSIEDAVEVIVGDIEDEYDEEEGEMIVPDGKGGYLADARASVEELAAAIGTDLAAGEEGEEIDTVGGLVFSIVGRIPVRGELISAPGGYEFEVLDADPRRVKRVRIYRRPASEARRRPPRPPTESSSAA
jgi:CBS domain containing-hemolysin-like protein